MKLVAAAKVRRAQEAVVNGRPFSENLVKVGAGRGPWGWGPGMGWPGNGKAWEKQRVAGEAGLGPAARPHARTPRPLPAAQVLYGVNQRLRVEDVDSPLVAVRPVRSVLLVVLTGDRGLCGGYNKCGRAGGWGRVRAGAAAPGPQRGRLDSSTTRRRRLPRNPGSIPPPPPLCSPQLRHQEGGGAVP